MKRYNLNKTAVIACTAFSMSMLFLACKKTPDASIPTAITTTGAVTTFAGSGASGFANGTGTAATFNNPTGVAIDAAGNVYVADQINNAIRKITAAGVVTTLSGNGVSGRAASAIGVSPTFNNPAGVAVDAAGTTVYVADYSNNEIRKIVTTGATSGTVTLFAGSATALTGSANGTGSAATFNAPAGIALDATGNVYVADFNNNLIRKITAAGVVTTLAGSKAAGNADGTGTAASFNGPRGVAVDAAGNVYVADANNNLIRKITAAGVVTTLAGNGAMGNANGTGTAASFAYPSGVAVDAAGNVFVADANNNLVRKVAPNGGVTSMAGSGFLSLRTPFNGPTSVAVDAAGTVYVADTYRQIIQKVK